MNYRHAFHAGNFADCMKHALLAWLLRALAAKPTPFRVLDTHAGTGGYDLSAGEAMRTGEWRRGIGRLLDVAEGPLADYVALVRAADGTQGAPAAYPGSPALIRALLRPQDHLLACELHPEDHATLRARFRRDPQVAIHHRDGWEALKALTPFPEKRGLVLVDPPFEQEGEFDRLAQGIALVSHRFRAAIQACWYPIKHRAPVRAFHAALQDSGVRDLVAAELWLREPTDPTRLNGCGLLVANPPWKFEAEGGAILAALLDRLGDGEPGQGWAITRIAEE
ncbi:23S rRNA (adenine(2030)-N(6))-methyltransferase RlmJ [Paracraurococcus ruber]|uniref:Ribosomal RNA large subunit methyltransferase J n=1 Tax=Paracraurococcus ruber TaxID=77675 RepID=A0ABS1D479_9PROT|nr:23S rRNA (adenine(2030)-N(6))-methyltransferase RlmJ [Paracraurococcus ruber]MBK1661498.1 23S rRNA (adenine(2030)-N(6))-methyltransferase RlmJ [Paracraurococcus ruber]TDG28255.1 23S rRNA (adenine(2030)-N(6))-methyltransferase RlmJ [Paracraurococcus ruber]